MVTPVLPRAPRKQVMRGTVVDHVAMAWANSAQTPYNALPAEFVRDYRDDLDLAATELLGPRLAATWEARGYLVAFGTPDEVDAHPLPTALYHQVWDDAAARLDPDLIVRHAGLDETRRTYS